MAPQKPRRLWIVHAELPAPITIETWTVEAKALGFDGIVAARLCFFRWAASLDPERIERRKVRKAD